MEVSYDALFLCLKKGGTEHFKVKIVSHLTGKMWWSMKNITASLKIFLLFAIVLVHGIEIECHASDTDRIQIIQGISKIKGDRSYDIGEYFLLPKGVS